MICAAALVIRSNSAKRGAVDRGRHGTPGEMAVDNGLQRAPFGPFEFVGFHTRGAKCRRPRIKGSVDGSEIRVSGLHGKLLFLKEWAKYHIGIKVLLKMQAIVFQMKCQC
jgi:hypothetical protein